MIGTNDAKIGTSPLHYQTAYDQLLVKTRLINRESQLIIILIPLLREGVTLPYVLEMNEAIGQYNQIITGLARKHGAQTLEMKLEKEHFFDGVHFNEKGSQEAGCQLSRFLLNERGMFVE